MHFMREKIMLLPVAWLLQGGGAGIPILQLRLLDHAFPLLKILIAYCLASAG